MEVLYENDWQTASRENRWTLADSLELIAREHRLKPAGDVVVDLTAQHPRAASDEVVVDLIAHERRRDPLADLVIDEAAIREEFEKLRPPGDAGTEKDYVPRHLRPSRSRISSLFGLHR